MTANRQYVVLLLSLVLLVLLASCTEQKSSDDTSSTASDTTNAAAKADTLPSLTAQLQAKREKFEQNADATKKEVYAKGIQDVRDSGIAQKATNVGDKAPNFSLPDATGAPVKLSKLLKEGPVVITWYRGGWCPYCNLTLRAYQQRMEEINALGAEFVAISPEVPDSTLSTKEKNELEYFVLSDVGNVVAQKYGIVYALNPDVLKYYNAGANFQAYYKDKGETRTLPLSATYVVAPDGTVEYAFLDADYRRRADPDEVLKVLERLRQSME